MSSPVPAAMQRQLLGTKDKVEFTDANKDHLTEQYEAGGPPMGSGAPEGAADSVPLPPPSPAVESVRNLIGHKGSLVDIMPGIRCLRGGPGDAVVSAGEAVGQRAPGDSIPPAEEAHARDLPGFGKAERSSETGPETLPSVVAARAESGPAVGEVVGRAALGGEPSETASGVGGEAQTESTSVDFSYQAAAFACSGSSSSSQHLTASLAQISPTHMHPLGVPWSFSIAESRPVAHAMFAK